MRFSSIEIHNYRQYKDLDLVFPKGSHDIQLIVGDNGTGKTNLLNAFTWCLYGEEPHLGGAGRSSNKDDEPRLNKVAIADCLARGANKESVSVLLVIDDDNATVKVHRNVSFSVNGLTKVLERTPTQSFVVTVIGKDGRSRALEGEIADAYLNRLLPRQIKEYFFFDGEQLNNYFSEARAQSGVLSSAVKSISKIDSLTRMRERTQAAAKKLMSSARKDSPDLASLVTKIADLEKKKTQYQGKQKKFEAEAADARKKVDELSGKLRDLPDIAKLEKKRDSLSEKKQRSEKDLNNARERYCVFARRRYVDFAFYEAAKDAVAAIEQMEHSNLLPPAIDRNLLESMLKHHRCEVCKRELSEKEEDEIKALLDLYQVGTETSNLLTNMRGELRNLIRRVESYPKDRDSVLSQLDSAEQNLEDTSREWQQVDEEIRTCPNSDGVKLWAEQRSQFEKAYSNAVSEAGVWKGRVEQVDNVIDKIKREYDQAKVKKGLNDEFQLAGDFGLRAAEILSSVEEEVIDETRRLMQEQTESVFKGLVWKDSKCDHIDLDDKYQLSLYDVYGYSCANTCSAAERALLALSFTLSMHNVSGFDSPLFIDTPIARASGENRANFARTLADVSKGKQLILTFTPDEYSESIAKVFDPIVASSYRLALDDDERQVSVQGGF